MLCHSDNSGYVQLIVCVQFVCPILPFRLKEKQAVACDSGDYVSAAISMGAIPAEWTCLTSLPDFRELALWFHARSEDSTSVAQAKVRCTTLLSMCRSLVSLLEKKTSVNFQPLLNHHRIELSDRGSPCVLSGCTKTVRLKTVPNKTRMSSAASLTDLKRPTYRECGEPGRSSKILRNCARVLIRPSSFSVDGLSGRFTLL